MNPNIVSGGGFMVQGSEIKVNSCRGRNDYQQLNVYFMNLESIGPLYAAQRLKPFKV